jgi:hypothetical protein
MKPRIDPFLGRIEKKEIKLSVPVYIVASSVAAYGYSFSSSTIQAAMTINENLATDLNNNTEFTNYKSDFALFKIDGVKLQVNNTQGNTSTFTNYPGFVVDVIPNYASLAAANVFDSDTALLVSPNNTNKVVSKYYPFRGNYSTAIGYPVCGDATWISTAGYTSSNVLYLCLGFRQLPSNASTQVLEIAEVEVTVLISYAKSVKTA